MVFRWQVTPVYAADNSSQLMTRASVSVLITRSQPGADEFADLCRLRLRSETPVVVSPIIDIKLRAFAADLSQCDYLIATSGHAFSSLDDDARTQGLVCYCVGDATAQRAAELGFDAVSVSGNVHKLAEHLISERPNGQGLYLRGREVAVDLLALLAKRAVLVDEVITYEQAKMPLNQSALDLLSGTGKVVSPIFSPRSAEIFSRFVVDARAQLIPIAMSPNVARALSPELGAPRIARAPNAEAVLHEIADVLTADDTC